MDVIRNGSARTEGRPAAGIGRDSRLGGADGNSVWEMLHADSCWTGEMSSSEVVSRLYLATTKCWQRKDDKENDGGCC